MRLRGRSGPSTQPTNESAPNDRGHARTGIGPAAARFHDEARAERGVGRGRAGGGTAELWLQRRYHRLSLCAQRLSQRLPSPCLQRLSQRLPTLAPAWLRCAAPRARASAPRRGRSKQSAAGPAHRALSCGASAWLLPGRGFFGSVAGFQPAPQTIARARLLPRGPMMAALGVAPADGCGSCGSARRVGGAFLFKLSEQIVRTGELGLES